MREPIAHTRPCFGSEELAAVTAVIKSRAVNQGTLTDHLIARLASETAAAGGVAVSTATLGLHLALKSLGVSAREHEVIIPDYSCRCLYDAVVQAGGSPRYCDISLHDLTPSIDSIRSLVNPQTRAIIVPHLFGTAADSASINALGLPVIEDCAHCIKAERDGVQAGSIGDYTVYSFEGSKLIAAGEGGAVIARTPERLAALKCLRNGTDCAALHYRMSDLVAAVAHCQLDKLDSMLSARRSLAAAYQHRLEPLYATGELTACNQEPAGSDCYRFVVLCRNAGSLISFANERGILLRNPMREGCLSDLFGSPTNGTPNSHLVTRQAVSLPIYPDLTNSQQEQVVATIFEFFSQRGI